MLTKLSVVFQYEAEKVHTVHLVCVPPRDAPVIKTSVNSNLPDVQQVR